LLINVPVNVEMIWDAQTLTARRQTRPRRASTETRTRRQMLRAKAASFPSRIHCHDYSTRPTKLKNLKKERKEKFSVSSVSCERALTHTSAEHTHDRWSPASHTHL